MPELSDSIARIKHDFNEYLLSKKPKATNKQVKKIQAVITTYHGNSPSFRDDQLLKEIPPNYSEEQIYKLIEAYQEFQSEATLLYGLNEKDLEQTICRSSKFIKTLEHILSRHLKAFGRSFDNDKARE